MVRSLLVACTLAALAAGPATAQPRAGLPPRGVLSVNGGWQAPSRTFTDSFTFDQYVEQGKADLGYEVAAGPVYEAGLGVRVWKTLGVGVSFSKFTDTSSAKVTASVPHPFFFDRPRTLEGAATGITRDEATVNAQVIAFVPAKPRILLVLSAGPSFVTVKQDLVSRVRWDESYPFDTATYRTVDTTAPRRRATGFNAGADIIFRVGRSFGLGALLRFTRARINLAPSSGRKVSVDAGGFQAGGGLRVFF